MKIIPLIGCERYKHFIHFLLRLFNLNSKLINEYKQNRIIMCQKNRLCKYVYPKERKKNNKNKIISDEKEI